MIRADVQTSYFRKFLWIACACVLFIAWCAFDKYVTYPNAKEIAEAYESFPETEEGQEQWAQLAQEKGWSTKSPDKSSQQIQGLINNQTLMMAAGTMVGIFMLLKWYLPRGTWIEGDDTLIRHSRGREVSLSHLVSIDTSKWEEKGIAVLRFKGGGASKFVLDDFKFEEEATGRLLEIAKEQLAGTSSNDDDASLDQDAAN